MLAVFEAKREFLAAARHVNRAEHPVRISQHLVEIPVDVPGLVAVADLMLSTSDNLSTKRPKIASMAFCAISSIRSMRRILSAWCLGPLNHPINRRQFDISTATISGKVLTGATIQQRMLTGWQRIRAIKGKRRCKCITSAGA